jgi:hypothetical protein
MGANGMASLQLPSRHRVTTRRLHDRQGGCGRPAAAPPLRRLKGTSTSRHAREFTTNSRGANAARGVGKSGASAARIAVQVAASRMASGRVMQRASASVSPADAIRSGSGGGGAVSLSIAAAMLQASPALSF